MGALNYVLLVDNPFLDRIDDGARNAVKKEDYGLAHRILRPLAEQGDVDAQVLLGALYDDGCGTDRNVAESVKFYKLASDQSHSVGQLLLAWCYRDGDEVRKDWDKMLELQLKAADQGYASALYAMAGYYYFGQKGWVDAYKWAKLAASHLKFGGHKTLMKQIVESLGDQMTSEELAEAERLVSEWKPPRLYT